MVINKHVKQLSIFFFSIKTFMWLSPLPSPQRSRYLLACWEHLYHILLLSVKIFLDQMAFNWIYITQIWIFWREQVQRCSFLSLDWTWWKVAFQVCKVESDQISALGWPWLHSPATSTTKCSSLSFSMFCSFQPFLILYDNFMYLLTKNQFGTPANHCWGQECVWGFKTLPALAIKDPKSKIHNPKYI